MAHLYLTTLLVETYQFSEFLFIAYQLKFSFAN